VVLVVVVVVSVVVVVVVVVAMIMVRSFAKVVHGAEVHNLILY
jgi:hypothetical protein